MIFCVPRALSLLLVFRTNTSYARWLEARQAWGRIVSHCRNIMRQATLWLEDDDPSALDELVVDGIRTNAALHRELVTDSSFMAGGVSIHYLESKLEHEH